MPLTLVTGPANAAKAGEVLGRFNAALPLEPLLVVPTAADSDHYARELAEAGIVLGAEGATFYRLGGRGAAGPGGEAVVIGRVARARVLRSIVVGAELKALARSAASPGFPDALGTLFE